MLPRRLRDNFSYTPIGSLNQRVQLLKARAGRDPLGDPLDPDVFATCWASVKQLSSKYSDKKEQVVTEATHKIVIRYIPGVTSAMMVSFNGALFNITSVDDPDNLKVELWLSCYQRNDGR